MFLKEFCLQGKLECLCIVQPAPAVTKLPADCPKAATALLLELNLVAALHALRAWVSTNSDGDPCTDTGGAIISLNSSPSTLSPF